VIVAAAALACYRLASIGAGAEALQNQGASA
jgi:hypothetical protein